MLDELRTSLTELGLGNKAAEVYLGMLQLGPSNVQSIAETTGINRSTAYLLIEELKQHGLVTTFEKGKKMYFSAENPQRLVTLVVEEFSTVRAKQERLDTCLPELLALFNARDDKPKVRFFEGEEAFRLVRKEIAESRDPVWEVYAVDETLMEMAKIQERERIQVTERVKSGRALMAIKPGCIPPYFDLGKFDVRAMDYRLYPFSGDITLTGSRLYVLSTQHQPMGIIVESEELTTIFRALYEAAWSCATAWSPPVGWGGRLL